MRLEVFGGGRAIAFTLEKAPPAIFNTLLHTIIFSLQLIDLNI